MRKVILGLAVSLDSFIEGPNGEYDWCFTDQDYGLNEFFGRIDAIFIGRKSFELAQELGEAAMMPPVKQYVFSNSMTEVPADCEIVSGDIAEQVKQIKRQAGKDIWLWGGASLTASLINEGLVDELWLSVHPILLGSGKPLFRGISDRIKLTLLETKTYETGLVSLKYLIENQ
ncbi:MAG: dihydrofolate reductase [Bacteroidetes bacterium]|nr:dihydrofolate reductase [Bacteroidota bacterium]